MRRLLKPIFFLTLMSVSTTSYAVEAHSDVDLECIIAADNHERGYTKKLYDDIFVIELRRKTNGSKILWKRKHPGESDYTFPETIRGCAFADWTSTTLKKAKKFEVTCDNDGEDGSLMLDPKSLEGELSFYYPQIGYSERSDFAVVCKIKSK